jgi:hypothetical protein
VASSLEALSFRKAKLRGICFLPVRRSKIFSLRVEMTRALGT